MKIYLLRVRRLGGDLGWTVASADHIYNAPRGTSRDEAVASFQARYGKATEVVRFKGIHRLAEAAMTLASISRGDPS